MADSTSPASGYAIIETGGKQYRVAIGDTIIVEKLDADSGTDVTFDKVLMVGGEGATRVGAPSSDGATVTASLDEQSKGDKIVVFKYKPKKRYRRRIGHRQFQSELTITGINA